MINVCLESADSDGCVSGGMEFKNGLVEWFIHSLLGHLNVNLFCQGGVWGGGM